MLSSHRDFKRLSTDLRGAILDSPCPDNIMLWDAVIFELTSSASSCIIDLVFALK